jgi:nitrite reductase/ring-hydroxylating ferredoxin subunit
MEKYTKNGKHLGEFDVTTGKMLNGPIAGRKVDK